MPSTTLSSQPTLLERLKGQGDLLTTGALLSFLVIMIIPLPPVIMDFLLACSIASALLMLLVTFYVEKPVKFSVFPLLLLGTTLYRLSLNVASTRLILLHGADGPGAAGNIIQTFGQIVVGGSYIVGLVVFIILIIINFMVVTKGAGRVAEVAARFTLDAMPGKQMAIDAELNSGMIDEKKARSRRKEVAAEADFYGAMDGASKFIRGDAIAGILITIVNILGGLLIGVVQEGMTFTDALQVYTVLTIGDGLVGQIPALVISAAAGMLVTRVSDEKNGGMHEQLSEQLIGDGRPMALLSVALFGFMLMPGLRVPFFLLGSGAGYIAYRSREDAPATGSAGAGGGAARSEDEPGAEGAKRGEDEEMPVELLLHVEPLAIELGVELLRLVDERKGGDLVARIQRIRRQMVKELGLLVPAVNLRDNMDLNSGEYRILLRGEEIGRGQVVPNKVLAINPGDATQRLKGAQTIDPVFGLPAYWISDKRTLRAQSLGYTVVDIATVLTTHFTELLHDNGHELYNRQQLSNMLERVAESSPRLVEELVPETMTRGSVLRVFRNLLREGVSIRDNLTILETLGEYGARIKDPDVLTEYVRQALRRHISLRFATDDGTLHYIGLAPDAQSALERGLQSQQGGTLHLNLSFEDQQKLMLGLKEAAESYKG
ncbi:MAG: flagellar biosynthesis protein FlhA, partial [Myxococcota bacterium]